MIRDLDLEPDHLTLVRHLLAAHLPRPARIWVIGSRATGTARPHSDLDLVIDAGRPLTLAEQADLRHAFEEAPLPWRVDLVDWATATPSFRHLVDAQRVPLTTLPAERDASGA